MKTNDRNRVCPLGLCIAQCEKTMEARQLSPAQVQLAKYFNHDQSNYLVGDLLFALEMAVCHGEINAGGRDDGGIRMYPLFETIRLAREIELEHLEECRA